MGVVVVDDGWIRSFRSWWRLIPAAHQVVEQAKKCFNQPQCKVVKIVTWVQRYEISSGRWVCPDAAVCTEQKVSRLVVLKTRLRAFEAVGARLFEL